MPGAIKQLCFDNTAQLNIRRVKTMEMLFDRRAPLIKKSDTYVATKCGRIRESCCLG